MRWDWNDVRIFVAVATSGSTSAAARQLGIAQTTCARRIGALESATKLTLFDRSTTRFVLNQNGRSLLAAAQAMDAGAHSFELLAQQARRGVNSVLKVSAADILADQVVQPALDQFRRSWPEVRIELAVEGRIVDITAGEADIALRVDFRPTDPGLVAKRLAANPLAVYCAPEYAERHGRPGNLKEFVERPFAVLAGRTADRLAAGFPHAAPRMTASSVRSLAEAVASGDLAAILPTPHGDRVGALIRCFAIEVETGAVWLVHRAALRGQPHVRDLTAAISASFKRWSRQS